MRSGLTRSEGAPSAIPIVVAYPDRHRDVVGETDEPCIVFVFGRASLARNVGSEITDCVGRPALQHALQHGLQLIERGWVN